MSQLLSLNHFAFSPATIFRPPHDSTTYNVIDPHILNGRHRLTWGMIYANKGFAVRRAGLTLTRYPSLIPVAPSPSP